MKTTATTTRRRDTLNLRVSPEERNLIDRASEEALLARTILSVSAAAYAEFLARLDAPTQPSERLRETMQAPAPWAKR